MALSPTLRILLIGLTGLLSASGLALLLANTAIFDAIFRWQLVLSPESASFPMWQKLPEPMTMRCFLFQVIRGSLLVIILVILFILYILILVIFILMLQL